MQPMSPSGHLSHFFNEKKLPLWVFEDAFIDLYS